MYKLKQKEGYRKVYNVRLCKGEIHKATTELKDLINRLGDYTEEAIESSEEPDEMFSLREQSGRRGIQDQRHEGGSYVRHGANHHQQLESADCRLACITRCKVLEAIWDCHGEQQ